MRCSTCEFYKDDVCLKAETSLSEIDDPICLQRITCILLRSILEELYDDGEEGESWKRGQDL